MPKFLDKHRSYLKESCEKIFIKKLSPVSAQLDNSADLIISILFFRIILKQWLIGSERNIESTIW